MFASLGAATAVEVVHWNKVGEVGLAIIMSILLSGAAGFLIQRAFRGAIREDARNHDRVQLHGPWIAGLMLTWLAWFMLAKGLKGLAIVKWLKQSTLEPFGTFPLLLLVWFSLSMLIMLLLMWLKHRGTRHLFAATAIIGMLCMAFAFGQNDLANCASPGLSALWLYRNADQGVAVATEVPIARWALFGCGLLMALGMTTRNAQRVTRAAVNAGSQFDHVAVWAPEWCRAIARKLVQLGPPSTDIAPPVTLVDGKRLHYDTLRASVIMAVSASVIAFASSRGLPVSTTYVGFAAVIATGWGDRIFQRGDADIKLGRAIWVAISWFLAALIATLSAGIVAYVIFQLGILGLGVTLGTNLSLRFYFKRRADTHERRYHLEAGQASGPQAERASGVFDAQAARDSDDAAE